jgi:hypothetical protein
MLYPVYAQLGDALSVIAPLDIPGPQRCRPASILADMSAR